MDVSPPGRVIPSVRLMRISTLLQRNITALSTTTYRNRSWLFKTSSNLRRLNDKRLLESMNKKRMMEECTTLLKLLTKSYNLCNKDLVERDGLIKDLTIADGYVKTLDDEYENKFDSLRATINELEADKIRSTITERILRDHLTSMCESA